MHKFLELFTQSELADIGSIGGVKDYEMESETLIFASALFALLTMLFWWLTIKVWFE